MINNNDIISCWNNFHEGSPPVGFLLRIDESDRFLRIHSFSQGKRYPKDKKDFALVLEKFTEITNVLFTKDEKVGIFLIDYGNTFYSDSIEWNLGLITDIPIYWKTKIDEYNDIEGIKFITGSNNWKDGCADAFCMAASENTYSSIALFSYVSGNTVCPYDGGFDIFIPDNEKYQNLTKQFKNDFP